MRALPLAVIAVLGLVLAGCGSSGTTLESLAGTPAAIHIVKDLETMVHACKAKSSKARQAGLKAYTGLGGITAAHPNATFGPEGSTVTMRELLRHTVEKTGPCIGVTVDAKGRYHTTR